MVKISENLKNLINADSRSFKARLKNGDDLFDKIISLKKSVVFPSSAMSVGNALCSCIECTASDIPISVAGKRLEAEITIFESAEWIKLGSFTAQKPTVQDGNVTFTAYDAMDKASNQTYSSTLSVGSHTAAEYFEDICAQLNEPFVPLDEASANLEIAEDKLSGYSCRDALSYLAGFLGQNCIVNRDGRFEMVGFTVVDYYMLNPDRIAEPELSDADSIISYLACCIDEETTLMSGEGSSGFEFISPLMTQERLDDIHNVLCNADSPIRVYKSGRITQLLGDPTLDICDVISLSYEGKAYAIPIMSLVLDFDGGLQAEIESFDLAEPNSLSLSERLSFEQKQSKEKTEGTINAMIEFSNAIQRAFGISHTTIGGITYFHDTETITDATYIYCMTTKGIAFADSWGGSHEKTVWKYGIDNDGNAIFNMLKAGKISSYDGKTYFDLSKGEICCQLTDKSHEGETIGELKAVFSLGQILLSNTIGNVETQITPQSMDFNIQEEGTEDEYIKPETDAEWNKALQETFGVKNPDWTNMASWLKGVFTKLHAAFWSYANKKGITISSTSDSGKTTNKNFIRGNRVVMKKTSDSTSVTTEYTADGIKSNQKISIDALETDISMSHYASEDNTFETTLTELFSAMKSTSYKKFQFYDKLGLSDNKYIGTLWKYTPNYGVLEASNYMGYSARKCFKGGAWQPWEWINPPMEVGVEYRTTERYKDKPVYKKLVNFGALPNTAATSVSIGKGLTMVPPTEGMTYNGNYALSLSIHNGINSVYYNKSDGKLYVDTKNDASKWFAEIVVKYTK